jgi:NAD(P)-dependent dehydrogenase (short-subunit alcohol dehydrogenase family)
MVARAISVSQLMEQALAQEERAQQVKRLEAQVAIVTGGGRGIGREVCLALAGDGARVAVVARTEDQVQQTAQEIAAADGGAVGIPTDVTDLAAVESMVDRVTSELGPVDLLVNNAGSNGAPAPTVEADPVAWWRDVTINLLGPFHTCRAVLPGMVRRGRGRIINVMGAGTAEPYAYLSGYGSSKAALMRFTETVDIEVHGHGVSAFALDPGLVRTEMNEALLRGGIAQRLFPEAVLAFEAGLDSPPTMAADLAVEIASGRLDDFHGRWLGAQEDLDAILADKDRTLAKNLRTLRLRSP